MPDQPYEHPAFPQPDPSVVLWRYMDACKFAWLVEHKRLFMPRADRLGDPLEGTTPAGELKWWQREATGADTDEMRRIIEHNRAFLSRMAKAFRDNYYISCWHMNTHENHAMWGCYTKQPESVAITITYAALRASLPPYVDMGTVRYIDYASDRLPTMNMFEYIMHKDSYYGFESEVRAVAFPPAVDELGRADFLANRFESESDPGLQVFAPAVDPARLIKGVVLHPEASSAFEAEITALCLSKGLPRPERSRRNQTPVF
jgi:hypothetical protein